MGTRAAQTHTLEGPAYLDQLRALAEELNAAMEAVGANALGRLEESVSRQEVLCAGLVRMGRAAAPGSEAHAGGTRGTRLLPGDGEQSLGERIRKAAELLQELNRRYAALIEHSSESTRLFAGLCRGYRAPYAVAGVDGEGHSGLSCRF